MPIATSLGEWDPREDYTCNCENGKCTGCGECCSDFLPLTEAEIRRIKTYVEKHGLKPHKQTIPSAEGMLDFTCPFRNNEEGLCDIYDIRPAICRHYICTMEPQEVRNDPSLLAVQRTDISMRATFFGDDSNINMINTAAFRLAMAAKGVMSR